MNRFTALRGLIKSKLGETTGATYHRIAPVNAEYPYKVFSFQSINLGDLSRADIDVCIDIWDRGQDPKRAETIADQIISLLAQANLPQEFVLPTFYSDNATPVTDPDRELIHYQLHFTVQTY